MALVARTRLRMPHAPCPATYNPESIRWPTSTRSICFWREGKSAGRRGDCAAGYIRSELRSPYKSAGRLLRRAGVPTVAAWASQVHLPPKGKCPSKESGRDQRHVGSGEIISVKGLYHHKRDKTMRLRKRQRTIAPEGATSVSASSGARLTLRVKLPIGVHLESYQGSRTELIVPTKITFKKNKKHPQFYFSPPSG